MIGVVDARSSTDVVERPEYAGCKTWVELDTAVPTDGASPVLSDEAFAAVAGKVAALSSVGLCPTSSR